MSDTKTKKTYPMTGFDKISWEEFMGIVEMLKLFNSLDDLSKDAVMLMMDGMRYREKEKIKEENKDIFEIKNPPVGSVSPGLCR